MQSHTCEVISSENTKENAEESSSRNRFKTDHFPEMIGRVRRLGISRMFRSIKSKVNYRESHRRLSDWRFRLSAAAVVVHILWPYSRFTFIY